MNYENIKCMDYERIKKHVRKKDELFKAYSRPGLKTIINERIENKEINPIFLKSKEKMMKTLNITNL